jgi:hypothetical protein
MVNPDAVNVAAIVDASIRDCIQPILWDQVHLDIILREIDFANFSQPTLMALKRSTRRIMFHESTNPKNLNLFLENNTTLRNVDFCLTEGTNTSIQTFSQKIIELSKQGWNKLLGLETICVFTELNMFLYEYNDPEDNVTESTITKLQENMMIAMTNILESCSTVKNLEIIFGIEFTIPDKLSKAILCHPSVREICFEKLPLGNCQFDKCIIKQW